MKYIEMKYMELDFERVVIRVYYRPLDISPTNYMPYKIYKLNAKRAKTIETCGLQFIPLLSRDICIVWNK